MEQDLNALIEKIKKDGIEEAEKIKEEIKTKAYEEAKKIKEEAKKEAEKTLLLAKEELEKLKNNYNNLLKQITRDTLINLRNEINNMLKNIINLKISEVLSKDDLAKVILEIIKSNINSVKPITVILSQSDFLKIKDYFFSLLPDNLKDKIILKPSTDFKAGFKISYDSEKSYFDFTDSALAEYISNFLSPELNKILLSTLNEK